ncbi:MAG: GatB/YqeY domain-containing protein [Pontibacterium sp.]
MSALKQEISQAVKEAMRAKQKERLVTLRGILAELKRIEVDERITLDDTRVIATLDKMLKQRRDSLAQFESADRQDLAEVERRDMEVIQTFLPQPLTEQEVSDLIDAAIASTQASSMQDMGKLMGVLKPQLQGRADMAVASRLVKDRLTR